MLTNCMVCSTPSDCRRINLYVTGSESLYLCHGCEMKVVEFIRDLMASRKLEFLRRKRELEDSPQVKSPLRGQGDIR